MIVGLEWQSEQIVGNPQVAVAPRVTAFGATPCNLLFDHADIRRMAAIVDEAVVAEAVVQPPEQHDIMLEAHIGATPAAATAPLVAALPLAGSNVRQPNHHQVIEGEPGQGASSINRYATAIDRASMALPRCRYGHSPPLHKAKSQVYDSPIASRAHGETASLEHLQHGRIFR